MTLPQFAQLLNLDTRLGKPIFELFDMDGNGKVDDYEFICGLALFTKTSQKQRLEALFNLFDANNSQTIDPQEFQTLIETIMKSNTTGALDAGKVREKIQELSGKFFLDKEFITLDQFFKIGFVDEDIRKSLLNLGVFMPDEAEIGAMKDDDLEAELGKFEEAENEEGDQALPNIRLDGVVGENDGLFQTEEVGAGDQFMAVKPFKGVVDNSVPSDYKPSKSDGDLPNATLSLHYIHGYRCHDARNNIYYSPDNKLVYHQALCGIQLDTKENKQKFVTGNTNDILSMDSWNDLSATGELGDKPTLCIWRNTTMEELVTFAGVMRKGIARIAFSRDGSSLACSCMDPDSMFYIWDVQKLIAGERGSKLTFTARSPCLLLQRTKRDPFGLEVRQRQQDHRGCSQVGVLRLQPCRFELQDLQSVRLGPKDKCKGVDIVCLHSWK